MEKILPIDTKQSIFDDPSKGSKQTIYFPCLSASISMTFSFSSETSKHVVYDECNMFTNSSFDKMSNFLTSSPWTLVLPDMPCL